jgi:NTP pyrophosphatase (non-canonical NTP hydrolase)
MNQLLINAINVLCEDCHNNSKAHGFWDEKRNRGEMFALMHSEISEALEYDRHGDPESDHIKGFSGVEEELADVLVRVFDFAGGFNLRLGQALNAKIEFNKTRPHKHEKEF